MISKNNKAFTLTEVIAAAVIIALLAAMAAPQYTTVIERFRADQARQVLLDIYAAQKRHFIENDAYATHIAQLDIDIPTMEKFAVDEPFDSSSIGKILRNKNGATYYTLSINDQGNITCDPADLGKKIGF